ncbi:hypothetical protein [Chryseobacterium hagamense]|uniref:Tetratricopeptide repeat protein n=1 Tax=Chryseobacterium hagamense TaxID=395935 RepID=A0A511YRK8_9FLAO|nr:hypothetical protein [Chryseobacterium hagamense]GEN77826.1 hypothetical protein CHA01nite_35660 [Chryseobacterium hagamense]
MNHRVLELLKAPKNIQSEDLNLLKEEINSFPYVQNIRALYLYGVHLYDKGNYQQVLSTTAAYTTDKKILYHLINGKIQQQPKPEIQQETEKPVSAENALKTLYKNKATGFPIKREEAPAAAEPEIKEEPLKESADKQQDDHGRILPPPREEIKHLYVNEARNRILYEGEENFLDDDTVETIDLESTLESGSIVTQKIEKKEEPSVVEENEPVENAFPETHEVQETGRNEESIPETADEEEEIHAESEEKSSINESGTVLQKQDIGEETENSPLEHTDSKTVDGGAVEEAETVITEYVEPERDTELSESDFHHIKVILDTLGDDSEKAEPVAAAENSDKATAEETEEFTPETIIEKENTGTGSEDGKVLNEPEVSFHETGAFLPETEMAADEPEEIKELENQDSGNASEVAGFTLEKIIDEAEISSEKVKDTVQDKSGVSFHETGAFLPETEIAADEPEEIKEPESQDSGNASEIAGFTPEKIINEDQISSEKVKEAVQDDSEVSFHGTESFLPEVKIQANEEEPIRKIPQQNLSKHEDEMRRLIEEVEKKMKEKAASEENKKEEEPASAGHDISFAETQDFNVKPAEPEMREAKEEAKKNSGETKAAEKEVQTTEQPIEKSEKEQEKTKTWKPMSFDANIPDSLLNKSAKTSPSVVELPEKEAAKTESQNEDSDETEIMATTKSDENQDSGDALSEGGRETAEPIGESETATQEKTEEEDRVMNVSFFGSGWTIPQPEKKENSEKSELATGENKSETPVEKSSAPKSNIFDSNIPGFINTWQSWLKIDRTEEVVKEKTELKNKVIETFIENNPRISQLKEESSFVIREKGDDISHLMTETLANLYFEQKLYTKAIKAFETLIRKTPEKKKYYEGKIQEIKDFRTKG